MGQSSSPCHEARVRNGFRRCVVSLGIWQSQTAKRKCQADTSCRRCAFVSGRISTANASLEQLLAATERLWPSYPLKRLVYRTLFGLLACTGLRISEALKLNADHVDLKHGVLRIEKTKFKKSRLVPLHADGNSCSASLCASAIWPVGRVRRQPFLCRRPWKPSDVLRRTMEL